VSATPPKDVAASFWAALYDRDWERIRSFFSPDSIYYDVPTGPATAAKGPDGIEARLRLGLETLSGYEHENGAVVADDEMVVTEHLETWHWPAGETVTLPFVSVQRIVDGKIVLWKDYWDYQTLMSGAPADWQERLATADLSWLFDATGIA
jgi:limonene-1,2-epoxide hydrolase